MSSRPFIVRSLPDLLATFSLADQDSVVLPKSHGFPLEVTHYFAWSEPSGVYTYLVLKQNLHESPRGIVLQRNGAGASSTPAGMCDWCHSTGPSDVIGLLTTNLGKNASGGTWLCLDLSCQEKIRERSGISAQQTTQLLDRMGERMSKFFDRVLGI